MANNLFSPMHGDNVVQSYKHFHVEIEKEVTVLHLQDADFFDRLVINELQDEMIGFVKSECPQKLLIHFGRVRALSSETINALLRAREYIVANDGLLKLCDMRDSIRKVFKITNLEGKLFDIYDSMAQALDGF